MTTPNVPVILEQASFNPDVRKYWLMGGTATLFFTIIGIPLLPFWWIFGMWVTQRFLDRMECTLTRRTLIVRKGWLVRVEKTIPLDKITDLGMIQGPLMRFFGIHALSIETAGSTQPGALVKLHGIRDVEAFRDTVLAQRDRMLEHTDEPSTLAAAPSGAEGSSAEVVALLREIRDELRSRP
jgi:putative membrane protein